MNNKTNVNIELGGPCFLLFLVFLILKLCKVITWSWWWVTAPLWIPLGLTLIVIGIVVIIHWIGELRWNHDYNKRHRNR